MSATRSCRRYGVAGRVYDAVSLEPVYRPGREATIALLGLGRGDQVLDIGCGTGLNLPYLVEAVGPRGRVVGVDASASMLRQAARRVARQRWTGVALVCADATALDVDVVRRLFDGAGADAVIATYALSLMPRWRDAWQAAYVLTRPGGRLGVVDMQEPVGGGRLVVAAARAAMAVGGADPHVRPWRAVEEMCTDVESVALRRGHIQVRVGTRP